MKRVILFLLLAECVFGVDFHVAKTGSDSNIGSSGSPFLTIQKAADAIAAHIATNGSPQTNYTAYIHTGIYSNLLANCSGANCTFVSISSSGTSSNPIILQSAGDGEVKLWGFGFSDLDASPADGDADGPNQSGKNEILMAVTGNYVQIKSLVFENSQGDGLDVDASHCLVEDCIARNNWQAGISIGEITHGICDANIIRWCETHHNRHFSGISLLRSSGATNVVSHTLVENCLSYRNGFDANNVKVLPISGDPSGGGNADGFTVGKECTDAVASTNFVNNNLCPSNVVRGVVAFQNCDDGFDTSPDSSLFEDNISFANGPTGQKGFKMLRRQTNETFVGNIAYANNGIGYDLRIDGADIRYHNTALYNGGTGFAIPLSGATVKNNLAAFNSGNDMNGTSSNSQTNNWVADGVGTLDNPSFTGDPKLSFTNLFCPLGVAPSWTNITVNWPTNLNTRGKLAWIKWNFKQAFQPKTGSGLIDSGATGLTYTDPISGATRSRDSSGSKPDIGTYEAYPKELPLMDGTRIVYVGDSITDAKRWTHYLSAYFALMFPQYSLKQETEGRGGTNLRELYTTANSGPRYPKTVYPYQSQATNMIVFLAYGFNNSGPTNQYYDDLLYVSTNCVIGSNSALPVLVSEHPINEADGGGAILGSYSDMISSMATNNNWPWADRWRFLTNIWEHNTIDGADTTHPGPGGHAMIAYSTIKLLGLETNVSSAVINGSSIAITSTNHCVISSLSAITDGISFVRLDDRLPWAIDEAGRTLAESLLPEIATFQNYGLTVSGLASGTYDIKIDGSLVATATHTALAAGVNMSTWHQGPIHNQLQEVLGRIRDCHWVDRTTLVARPNPAQGVQKYKSNAGAYYNPTNTPAQYFALMAPALTQIQDFDALIHTAAQPVARTFTIVNQVPSGGQTSLVGRKPRGLLFTQ